MIDNFLSYTSDLSNQTWATVSTFIYNTTNQAYTTIGFTETRSSSGCWTCRLRRKKCDESRPRCSSCNSLQISCFGYGPKPDWMDGSDMERAVAKATLDAVRQTTSRNRRSRRSQNTSNPNTSLETSTTSRPMIVDSIEPEPLSIDTTEHDFGFYEAISHDLAIIDLPLTSSLDLSKSFDDINSAILPKTAPTTPTNISVETKKRCLSLDSTTFCDDAVQIGTSSIMDYMDSVFFLQFPLHGPLAAVGGRGWLLWILIHVRPFQVITDALCAQCHRSLQSQTNHTSSNYVHDNVIEKNLSLLLSELNQYVGRVSLQDTNVREGKVGILACTIQLIFLEVRIQQLLLHLLVF